MDWEAQDVTREWLPKMKRIQDERPRMSSEEAATLNEIWWSMPLILSHTQQEILDRIYARIHQPPSDRSRSSS